MVKDNKIYLDTDGVIKTCAICHSPFFINSHDDKMLACAGCGTVYRKEDGLQIGSVKEKESWPTSPFARTKSAS